MVEKIDPFLIKEVRQVLSSRNYPVIQVSLLLGMLVTAFFSIKTLQANEIKQYFTIIVQLSAIASFINSSLIAYRQQKELDCDEGIGMNYRDPRHLMWGRAQSIMIQNAILLFPLLPFIAAAVVLPGVSAYQIIMIIYFLIILQLPFSAISLLWRSIYSEIWAVILLIIYFPIIISVCYFIPDFIIKYAGKENPDVIFYTCYVMTLLSAKYFLTCFIFAIYCVRKHAIKDYKTRAFLILLWVIFPAGVMLGTPMLASMQIIHFFVAALAMGIIEPIVSFIVCIPLFIAVAVNKKN